MQLMKRNRLSAVLTVLFITALVLVGLGACATGGATSGETVTTYDAPAATETPVAVPAPEEDVQVQYEGVWEGTLQVQGQELPIIVKFLSNPSAGDGRATMDIPAQRAYGLPLSNVTADGTAAGATVHFELVVGGPALVADVVMEADGRLEGAFTQGPATGGVVLSRTADLAPEDIPGERVAEPVAGTSAKVSLEADGVVLHGTLLLPDSGLPAPAVIIVAGSGPTDRDGNSLLYPGPNDGLRMLAEQLAGHGIASLRYDKRGISESAYEGYREEDLSFDMYVNDLMAWARWCENRDEISNLFLAGHSEGGLAVLVALGTNPEIANRELDLALMEEVQAAVDGAVCLAAPGRSFDELTLAQLRDQAGAMSVLYARSREIVDQLQAGEDVADIPPELATLFRPSVQPYLRSIFRFDPATLAAALSRPVLAIGGTEDIQVPASDAQLIAEAAGDSRLLVVEGMNHVLKMIPPGDMAANSQSYYDPSFELSPDVVEAVVDFVLEK